MFNDLPSPPEWDMLLSASQKNNVDDIRRLINEEGVPASHSNIVGQTALHIAALWGCVESLKELIELGANVNAQNKLAGMAPIHCTIRGTFQSFRETHPRRIQCLQLLLEAGADSTILDSKGKTVFDHLTDMVQEAQMRGFGDVQAEMKEMREILESGGVEKSKLFLSIENGDVDGAREALKEEVCDKEKNLGLMNAVEVFTSRIGEKGTDESSYRALADIIKLLLESGADANFSGMSSESTLEGAPLHSISSQVCSSYSSPSDSMTALLPHATTVVRYLLQRGAKISTSTESLLPSAAHRGRLGAVQFLIEAVGVSPNYKGRQGMTCLHFAARGGKTDVVAWLLDSGELIDVKVKDDAGKTAMDYAAANGKQDILDMLSKRT